MNLKNIFALAGDIISKAETALIKVGEVYLGKIDLGDGHFAQLAIPVASAAAKALVTEIQVDESHPAPSVDATEKEAAEAARALFAEIPAAAQVQAPQPTTEEIQAAQDEAEGKAWAETNYLSDPEKSPAFKKGYDSMKGEDGRTPAQVNYDAGVELAKSGGTLSDDASQAEKDGFDSYVKPEIEGESDHAAAPEAKDSSDEQVQQQ